MQPNFDYSPPPGPVLDYFSADAQGAETVMGENNHSVLGAEGFGSCIPDNGIYSGRFLFIGFFEKPDADQPFLKLITFKGIQPHRRG